MRIGINKIHHQGLKDEPPAKDKGFWDKRSSPPGPKGKSID